MKKDENPMLIEAFRIYCEVKKVKNNKKEYRLIYYDKAGHLPHAFCSLAPELPESIEVDKMIVSWFLEH